MERLNAKQIEKLEQIKEEMNAAAYWMNEYLEEGYASNFYENRSQKFNYSARMIEYCPNPLRKNWWI
ncbi:MAG: hypothetical protein HY22_01860 [[Candidatus Thermochlorobacteriaceae] bacterium GBChlB]|nr:MAG: hypothetical protein HY22_01860 [[Candidatus Thermochlorobacteriaceae] bacterium GBChlB]